MALPYPTRAEYEALLVKVDTLEKSVSSLFEIIKTLSSELDELNKSSDAKLIVDSMIKNGVYSINVPINVISPKSIEEISEIKVGTIYSNGEKLRHLTVNGWIDL